MRRRAILLLLLGILTFSTLWALEPPTKAELRQYALDGSLASRIQKAYALGNHLVAPELVINLRSRLDRLPGSVFGPSGRTGPTPLTLPPSTSNTLKSKGTVKVFALLINFPDYPALTDKAAIESKLFADGDGGFPYESLRNYYRRSSYGLLEIQGNVLGWYTPTTTRDGMPQTTAARESLIKEALTYFDNQGHDFSVYDNDNNGKIDYFIVIWTGPNNGWANFWWGYQTTFSSNFTLDGKSFSGTRYSWQWEKRNWPDGSYDQVVVMHETGHALGLPDYYDYDDTVGPSGGLGGMDMMDANRGDHNGFSKMLLDWIAPQVFNYGTKTFGLGASGNAPDALIFMPEYSAAQPFDEFFMVQNRLRVQNDLAMPGDGLLVWHVDARLTSPTGGFKYDNSTTAHKLLRLMEASGQERIERNLGATAADYYTQGKQFGPGTFPNSSRYDGTDSGDAITAIGPSGQTMDFASDIHYALSPPEALKVQRLINDYIFFRLADDKLTWSPSPKNHTLIVKYLVYKKPAAAGDVYVLLAEVPADAQAASFSYENRNLKAGEKLSYRVMAVDVFGVVGAPADISD